MSMTMAPSFTEQFTEQLPLAPGNAPQLIVAHTNLDLLARLDGAFPETPLLDCPQADWLIESRGLVEAIVRAAGQGLRSIVLVGDSLAFASIGAPEDGDDDGFDDIELLHQTKLAGTERLAAQEHFADQIQALISHQAIAALLADGELEITPLFYRAEADVFMIYQQDKGQFETLS